LKNQPHTDTELKISNRGGFTFVQGGLTF